MNSLSLSPTLRRIVLEAFILCVLSAAVGVSLNFKLIFNAFSGKVVSSTRFVSPVSEKNHSGISAHSSAFPIPVALEELDDLLASGAVLIDARNAQAYKQEHLPGALSLPYADVDHHLIKFKQQVPLEQTLVTYCSGYGCSDSFTLGERLIQEGYVDVLVYEGGLPEWQSAGRPLAGEKE
ncbi:rhodanese-like domain-containing protein [uncultured Desulfuromusa sp.]|uniref:rhodanese-like domain-containing protein n=1 Tax=uncultured Desulfuromusa sp. TaxID=219183 RepID=UPI002AA609BA|nr:rhodanese-like domain-containing protein [uncultured Desulfuromusa sp.]